jgi:hypothetical protein
MYSQNIYGIYGIYCGKVSLLEDAEGQSSPERDDNECFMEDGLQQSGNGYQGRNVVKDLLQDLGGRGHIITTDNYFTLIPLYLDLLDRGIMATGTLNIIRKYVPRAMFAKTVTRNQNIGWLDYRMHEEGGICCVVWKDKKPVVLLSTHALPIVPAEERPFV